MLCGVRQGPHPPDRITRVKGKNCGASASPITVENADHVVFVDARNRDQFDMSRFFWHHIVDPR